MKYIAQFVFMFFMFSCSAIADGAFGANWGASISDVKKQGISLEKKNSSGQIDVYAAMSMPKNLSIAEEYRLFFHSKDGLQKILMISKDITEDPTGREGKDLFSKLKEQLISKYGQPSNGRELVGVKLYDDYDEFYQCLAYAGCGMWTQLFNGPDGGTIGLTLKGLGRGKGYIQLVYEGPKWSDAVDELRSTKSKVDAEAL